MRCSVGFVLPSQHLRIIFYCGRNLTMNTIWIRECVWTNCYRTQYKPMNVWKCFIDAWIRPRRFGRDQNRAGAFNSIRLAIESPQNEMFYFVIFFRFFLSSFFIQFARRKCIVTALWVLHCSQLDKLRWNSDFMWIICFKWFYRFVCNAVFQLIYMWAEHAHAHWSQFHLAQNPKRRRAKWTKRRKHIQTAEMWQNLCCTICYFALACWCRICIECIAHALIVTSIAFNFLSAIAMKWLCTVHTPQSLMLYRVNAFSHFQFDSCFISI